MVCDVCALKRAEASKNSCPEFRLWDLRWGSVNEIRPLSFATSSQQFQLHYLYNTNPYVYICGCGCVALQKVFQKFICTLIVSCSVPKIRLFSVGLLCSMYPRSILLVLCVSSNVFQTQIIWLCRFIFELPQFNGAPSVFVLCTQSHCLGSTVMVHTVMKFMCLESRSHGWHLTNRLDLLFSCTECVYSYTFCTFTHHYRRTYTLAHMQTHV